jgi:GTP-binding protein HflX
MAKEKIIIIAVKTLDQDKDEFTSTVEELQSLGRTAGGTVEKVVTQNMSRIHPASYMGMGKLAEVKHEIEELEIDLVIANDELTQSQLRNIGDYLNVRIIDRSQLILDIFAMRAKTKEGKLQVELAQLEYLLPRLQGQGTQLSRLGGGIGTRGPGETKLETDRRHIRNRITDIKRRLEQAVKQRDQYRKRRKMRDTYQIALVGYTNAGKSTIFNRLTDTDSLEEDKLFATLDPLTRKLQLPSGFEALITDTVGFLQKLPTSLIAAFRSTLEEVTDADFILHVVDAAHPDQEQQQDTVLQLLKELGADTIPSLTVYNKKDKVEGAFFPMYQPHVLMSAYEQEDLNQLLVEIEKNLKNEWQPYAISVSPMEEKNIQRLLRGSIVEEQAFDPETNKYIVKGYIREGHPLKSYVFKGEEKE